MINIVFLDAKTVGEVQNFKILEKQGKLDIYETTKDEEILERSKSKVLPCLRLSLNQIENRTNHWKFSIALWFLLLGFLLEWYLGLSELISYDQ